MDDQIVQLPKHPNLNRLLVYLFLASFFTVLVVGFVTYKRTQEFSKPENTDLLKEEQAAQNEAQQTTGSISLRSKNGNRFPVGEPFIVEVIADSNDGDVVGYDVLLASKKELYDVKDVKSALPAFTAYQSQKKESVVSVTGVKKPEIQDQTSFDNEAILQITIIPKQKGAMTVSILPSSESEKTDFITTDTQQLFPSTASFEVEIY